MRSVALVVGLAGCHLVGGAGELEYHDVPTDPAAPAGGGPVDGTSTSAGGGGEGGAGEPTCSATSCPGPCRACADDACVPLASGEACGAGLCDGGGDCFVPPSPTATMFGAPGSYQQAYAAVEVDGDFVVVGSTGGSFTWGDGTVAGSASGDAFAGRVGPDGESRWTRSWGDGAWFQAATSVASLPGLVMVAGHYQGSLAGLPSTLGGFDGFVIAVDAEDGADAWGLALQGSADQLLEGLAAEGNLVAIGGLTTGSMLVGGSNFEASGTEPFVTVLDPTGEPRWSKALAGVGDEVAVATDGATVLFAGHHDGASSADGTALGAAGAFVVAYDAEGDESYAVGWPGAWVDAVTVDGSAVMAGRFAGSQPWGAGVEADGVADLWVASLDVAGAPRWSTAVAVGGATATVEAMCADRDERFFIGGALAAGGRLQGPDGTWLEAEDEDGFVLVFAADGTLLWATTSGTPGLDRVASLRPHGERTVAAGWAEGAVFGASSTPSDLDGWWGIF